jgi:hypothetical protein
MYIPWFNSRIFLPNTQHEHGTKLSDGKKVSEKGAMVKDGT